MTRKNLSDSQPLANRGDRPPALKPEHIAILRDIVTECAQASLLEIANALHRRCGVRVCAATIRRVLNPPKLRNFLKKHGEKSTNNLTYQS